MSGSSGSGGGASGPEVSCDRLVINTMLASPRPGAVNRLYSGLVLEVVLLGGAVVVQHDGRRLGLASRASASRLHRGGYCVPGEGDGQE